MNTLPKPKITVSARYLGPVFSLNGELSERRQNLIFARNGTGKSFLSRGLRYLDLAGDDKDLSRAAQNLVSDESPDGSGHLSISQGTTMLGDLELQKEDDMVAADVPERIFHVFSEDFVHEELRVNNYTPDSDIENQIAVDSENIKLKDAQEALVNAEKAEADAFAYLNGAFEKEKVSEVNQKAGVNKQLKDYKTLKLEDVLGKWSDKPDTPDVTFADILKDLDSLKAIPAEPVYPDHVVSIYVSDIDFDAIDRSLKRITSPSTVSEIIKQKIEAHRDFFVIGANLVTEHNAENCPFCEQSIRQPTAAKTIETYIAYFKDEEALHKNELRQFYKALKAKEEEILKLTPRISHQKNRFDRLKSYVPSQRDVQLSDCEMEIESTCAIITLLKTAIHAKAKSLEKAAELPSNSIADKIQMLSKTIEANNAKVAVLQSAIEKSEQERKALQRKACAVFALEFSRDHWGEFAEITNLRITLKDKRAELAVQEKNSPKTEAKERVAETFEFLLRRFFADKYTFDRDSFVLKRGENEMSRGPHRTLSDGEKTAIAFCYFVACMHRKVESIGDYQRLFLVFDDPVTSMSYDFVFTIAQTLKNLCISKQGDVSTNPSLIAANTYVRPELIILTHSSYFFNISLTNKVVREEAAFALHPDSDGHRLTRLNVYVAPFQQQLKDVFEVAENGREPDHHTGNAVRSVLEAVGRFCRPDKSRSLTEFITFLAGYDDLEIKSVMINSLSHGTYFDEMPPPDDLKLACKEAIKVVEKFAVGQLEIIRADVA